MALPFTVEQFFGFFRDDNTAVWPAQWFLVALALAALVAVFRPRPLSIFTMGLRCFAVPPTPRSPLFAPLLGCLVGAQAAFLMGVQPDLGLLAAAVVGMGLLATARQRPRTSKP